MVEPDRPLGAGDFIAEVHSAAEGPTHFELAEGAVLEPDESDSRILGRDGMDERISGANDFDRPNVFPDEAPDDFDAMAAHIHNGAPARIFFCPEPIAVRARVCLT